LLRDRDNVGAEVVFRNAIALESRPGFRRFLAEAIERQGRRAEAIEVLEQIINERIDDPDAYFQLGLFLLREGDVHRAQVSLRSAIAIEPRDSFVRLLSEANSRTIGLASSQNPRSV
jgi:tetratricopeptide (TPR) repeat protein